MNKDQAAAFLGASAQQAHRVVSDIAGPSHGDPGGYTIYQRGTCAYWRNEIYSIAPGNPNDCNCGAREHNLKVDEALRILNPTT